MGLLAEYFAATPRQAAAVGDDGPSADELPAVSLKLVDPSVLLGHLWAALAGRPFGPEYFADDGLVNEPSPDGPWLVRVRPVCRAVLAGASEPDRVRDAAAQWAEADEWVAEPDPEELLASIDTLRQVATVAGEPGRHLYCWVCQ